MFITSIANGTDKEIKITKIGVIYSEAKREYFPTEEQYITEKGALHDAKVIAEEIEKLGLKTFLYPGNDRLAEALREDKPDMVFNLVDSIRGNEYLSSMIPGLLDTMSIPYTGAGLLGCALNYNKFLTKKLLQASGVPVPNFQLMSTPDDQLDMAMRYPLFVKLNEIHGAVEISQKSVLETEKDLKEQVSFLLKTYEQPVLLEEYIVGREIVCYVLQGANTKIYMAEKVFNKPTDKYQIATFSDQWEDESTDESKWPYRYEKFEDDNLKELARKAFEVTRMEGYGKLDVRMDSSGRYYFIDVNVNPAFGPSTLNTAMGLIVEKLYGISFAEILKRLIVNTVSEEKI